MTPRKWFIDPWFIDPNSLDAPLIRLAESDIELYVFTEEELKEELRDAWEDSHATFEDRTNLSFESYWKERFGGGE